MKRIIRIALISVFVMCLWFGKEDVYAFDPIETESDTETVILEDKSSDDLNEKEVPLLYTGYDETVVDPVEPDLVGSTDPSAPTKINVNSKIKDGLVENATTLYYMFTLNAPGSVDLTFEHESSSGGGTAWLIEIFNSINMEEKYKIESMEYSLGETLPVTNGLVGLPAGTYYIKLSDVWERSIGRKYELTVNYERSDNWEKEIDSMTSKNKLSLGVPMAGAVQNGVSPIDYFEFTLPSAGKVDLTFEHESSSGGGTAWALELYNSENMEEKYKIESMEYSLGETLPVTNGLVGLPAGTYYIKLSDVWERSIGRKYELTVNYERSDNWEKEIDSTPQTITTDQLITGSIQNGINDIDQYAFDMLIPGSVYFTFSHTPVTTSSIVWKAKIYNSTEYVDKNLIQTIDITGNSPDETESPAISLSTGTYYIVITSAYDDYAKGNWYAFKINTPKINPESVHLDNTILAMGIGDSVLLNATVFPEVASDRSVIWKSSNSNVATVDETGLVKALKKGTATITATTVLGNKSATCKVTVSGPTELSIAKVSVKLDQKSYEWDENGVEPLYTITYKGKTVPAGEYEISYLNDSNYKAGTATAVISGTGIDADGDLISFGGTKKVKFKITPHIISSDDITVEPIGVVSYSLGGVKPEPVVKYNGQILSRNVDYTLSWKNNGAVTTDLTKKMPTVVIKGKGNFKGSRNAEFSIMKQTISETNGFSIQVKDKKWSKSKNSYRSTPVILDPNGKKLKAGKDYEKLTLDSYDFEGKAEGLQPEIGTIVIVTVIGKGNYDGSISGAYIMTGK